MPFNIQDLQHKLGPLAGAAMLLITFIVALLPGLGGHGSSEPATGDNVVFRVTDQNGFPRMCSVRADTSDPQTDDNVTTGTDGIYSLEVEPGEEVSLVFDCAPGTPGQQIVTVSVVAPETGTVTKDVVVNNPETSSLGSK